MAKKNVKTVGSDRIGSSSGQIRIRVYVARIKEDSYGFFGMNIFIILQAFSKKEKKHFFVDSLTVFAPIKCTQLGAQRDVNKCLVEVKSATLYEEPS